MDIGPKLAIIEKLEAPNFAIAAETRYEGIIVEKIAISTPST